LRHHATPTHLSQACAGTWPAKREEAQVTAPCPPPRARHCRCRPRHPRWAGWVGTTAQPGAPAGRPDRCRWDPAHHRWVPQGPPHPAAGSVHAMQEQVLGMEGGVEGWAGVGCELGGGGGREVRRDPTGKCVWDWCTLATGLPVSMSTHRTWARPRPCNQPLPPPPTPADSPRVGVAAEVGVAGAAAGGAAPAPCAPAVRPAGARRVPGAPPRTPTAFTAPVA
jgi:hypothetical protein